MLTTDEWWSYLRTFQEERAIGEKMWNLIVCVHYGLSFFLKKEEGWVCGTSPELRVCSSSGINPLKASTKPSSEADAPLRLQR